MHLSACGPWIVPETGLGAAVLELLYLLARVVQVKDAP
jgi:hypothetical protein